MKTKLALVLCILFIAHVSVKSQVKIGNNATTINSASLLELETTNKGFVLPRVSITDVSSSSPLNTGLLTGTVVYNTNSSTTGGSGAGIYYWDGSIWNFLANTTITGNYWSLTGNGGTNASSNFIGTTDAKDFVARTNNVERMRILGVTVGSSQVGWIGMGVTLPKSALDVAGNYSGKNVFTIQNTSLTGYSSVDMLDNSGALAGTFGFANSGTGGIFSGKNYFNIYGNDFVFTNNSGTYAFYVKGSNGYIGLNTNTPGERLHVVGNFYLTGAFMPGGLAGTSGYVLTSAGANTAPTWNNLNSLAWNLTGNSGTNASTNFIGTTDAVDFVARTSNIERLRITSAGNVGIGLTNPSYKLAVLSANNPLYLSGVQATGTFTADSILTINGGVVKKSPYSSFLNLGWSLTGNSGTNYATNFLGTNDNISMRFRTNNIQRMIVDSLGRVGIGLNNPAYALSILSASDPLYLSGVQATSTFSTDSILTINGGVVKKAPYSSLNTYWSLTGNSGTNYTTNFIGTTDNVSLRFRTNNTEQMILDSLGTLSVGSYGAATFNTNNPPKLSVDYGTTTSNTIAYFRGSIDDYFQINLRNKSNGINASTDYVATADDGTDSTNYIDFGINSSTYAPGVENFGGPHDGYLYTYARNLLIGAAATNSDIIFLLGGGKTRNNAIMRLNASDGHVVLGRGDNSTTAIGTTLRAPNVQSSSINLAGGSLTVSGGSSTGTATGGSLNISGGATSGTGTGGSVNITGGSTVGGTIGSVNVNASTNGATNINTGTSTGTVTLGNSLNNINLPKLSASSVVLTDASKNLTSTTPSSNTYLYYNGTNFSWQSAATLASFSVTAPLTYNNLTGVFGINQSSTSLDGYLSSTDWNTFNNKVGSITLNTPSSVFSNPINFSVSSGTATGTLSLNTQTANTVFAGPSSGLAATPTFRALVAADIPSLAGSYIQNQTILQASSNYNISGTGTVGGLFTSKAGHTNTGSLTTAGGTTSINASSNFATNINTGSSTGNVTIGNGSNNILLPKFNTVGGIIFTAAATGQIAGTGSDMTWDDVNNRLGVGLTNPSYKLSVLAASDPLYLSGVQATAAFSTDSVLTIFNGVVKKAPTSSLANVSWGLTGNIGTSASSNFIGTTDAVDLVTKTNNFERMRILGAANGSSQPGWVGMGITVPRSSLDVTGYYTNKNVLTLQNTSASGYSSVDMLDSTGTLKGTFGYANNNTGSFSGKDYFNIYGNDFMLTKSSSYDFYMKGSNGYIGLNTNTPTERLHVVGNIYLNGAFMSGGDPGTSGYILTSAGANTSPTWTKSTNFGWGISGNSSTTAGTNFIGTTDAVDFVTKTNNTERIRITSSGNVGVGTTSPQQSLSVGNGLNIDQNSGNTGSTVNALTFGSSSGEGIGSKRTSGGNQYGLDFYTAYNNRMTITNAGNVGIATTSPLAKLDINGNFKLGDVGTVNKNVVSFASTLASTSISAGSASSFFGLISFAASSTDITITIPSAANYLTSTQATVTVSTNFDLPTGVSIASARMISTSQVKIRFVNASTTAQAISGNLYITINEF